MWLQVHVVRADLTGAAGGAIEAVAQWAASRGFAVSHVGFTVEQDDRTGDRVVRVELEATMDEKKR